MTDSIEAPSAGKSAQPPARGLARFLRGAARRMTGWGRCRHGVSAVEFALVAPVLGFSLIATIDLGRGLTERMAIDHALRAGAQSAFNDPGAPTVLEVVRSAAAMNFTLDNGMPVAGTDPLSVATIRFCACPENVGFAVACSTVCNGAKPTFIYYRMSAQKTYRGRLIPTMTFNRSAQVQIR